LKPNVQIANLENVENGGVNLVEMGLTTGCRQTTLLLLDVTHALLYFVLLFEAILQNCQVCIFIQNCGMVMECA
jgi:hypothetical protein